MNTIKQLRKSLFYLTTHVLSTLLVTVCMAMQFPVAAQTNSNNIALMKPVKQNNTFEASGASRAVDGRIDGNWHAGSVSSTHGSTDPFWEVNLLDVYNINSITIYNRTDCCPERLNNFTIRVSETPFRYPTDGQVFNSDGSWFKNQKTFTNNLKGQYVRIQINGYGILSLAEVVINGTLVTQGANLEGSLPNIALGKQTRQSSVAYNGPSHLANDGNKDGNWHNGSVIHTNWENNPYWEVDLGKKYLIEEVKIHNRTDAGADRLNNFNIWVTNRPIDETNVRLTPFAEREQNFSPVTYQSYTGKKIGQFVRIELEGSNILNIAEVEVFGNEIGEFEVGESASNVLYKVSAFRNVSNIDNGVESSITKSISEGMDFSRTVAREDKHYWSLSIKAKTTVKALLHDVELEATAGTGGDYTNNVQNSQQSSYQESNEESIKITQNVPGGCTRYEIRKFIINQRPITYKFNNTRYTWYRINEKATPVGDITVMVFPNGVEPEFNATEDNWVTEANFIRVLNAHPSYRTN